MTKFKPGVRIRLNENWKPSGASSPVGTSGTVLAYEEGNWSRLIVSMDDQPNNRHYPTEEMIDIIPLTKDDQVVLDMATEWAVKDNPESRANLIAAVKIRNRNLKPSLEDEIALYLLENQKEANDRPNQVARHILALIESRKHD